VLYSLQSYTTLESGLIYTLHAFNNDSCRIRLVKLSVTALSVCIRLVLDTSLLFGSRYCVYSKVLATGQHAADEYCDRGTRVDINLLTFHKSNSKYTHLRSCRPTYYCWNTRRADETTFSLSLTGLHRQCPHSLYFQTVCSLIASGACCSHASGHAKRQYRYSYTKQRQYVPIRRCIPHPSQTDPSDASIHRVAKKYAIPSLR